MSEEINNTTIPEGAIPPDVVNVKEYRKYLILLNSPVLKNTSYTTSEGEVLNIGMLPHYLKKRIAHLSPQEQEDILDLKSKYNAMRAKVTTAKALAYGHSGRLGGRKAEELTSLIPSPFQADVIELLGRMFTVPEVVRIMGEENGIMVTEEDVKDVLKSHITEIERKREEFRTKVSDVRLYNKRARLEELTWMYSQMKLRYIALNTTDTYNSLLRTLEQIRKEAEGDVLNINGALDVNVEVAIQEHIKKEIYSRVNLIEVILGRVAARMNYDPVKLIAGLHNSYYAKFVGISGDLDENAEMHYPSSSPYDFAAIERNANHDVVVMKPEEVTPEQRSTAANVRSLFLSKIRKQREEAEQRQTLWATRGMKPDDQTGAEDVDGYTRPIKRGRGSGKDATPPSQTKKGAQNNRDYYSGASKKKEE